MQLETAENFQNSIRYTGQQYDELAEQYYLRARYYNPLLGRFMQEDVYQGDGLNLYAYCGNNPVVYCDPSGYTENCHQEQTGGDGGKTKDDEETYYFRGTTEGYEGNASLQRAGVTPASTDPLVATLFGTEANQHGNGVIYIIRGSDLDGINVSDGNVLRDLELEVSIEALPVEVYDRAYAMINVGQAQDVLKEMGFDVPSVISDIKELDFQLHNTPRLTSSDIKKFLDMIFGK